MDLKSYKNLDQKVMRKLLVPSFLQPLVDCPATPWLLAGIYFVIMAILSFSYHTIGNYQVETDFYWRYAPKAKLILNGIVPVDSVIGPVYPAVLAAFGFFIPDLFSAGLLLNVFSASATLFLHINYCGLFFSLIWL